MSQPRANAPAPSAESNNGDRTQVLQPGLYHVVEGQGDPQQVHNEMTTYHSKTLHTWLQRELYEHNHTRTKLHHTHWLLTEHEVYAFSLSIYISKLQKSNEDLIKRLNIAEEALHVSQMQLTASHRLHVAEDALHACQSRLAESQGNRQLLTKGHPERDQIVLVVPVDIKGRSCVCTGRHSREVMNFRLEIPLEIDDGQCLCGSDSTPTIHEVHCPTLVLMGTSLDDVPEKSAPCQDQISPLCLCENLRPVAENERTSAHKIHTLRGHKIDLINHTFEPLRDDSDGITKNSHRRTKSNSKALLENSAGEASHPDNVPRRSQSINGVLREDNSTANPIIGVSDHSSAVSACLDKPVSKLSVTNLLNCIEATEVFDQRSGALDPQAKVNADKLTSAGKDDTQTHRKDTNTTLKCSSADWPGRQADEHNDTIEARNSGEYAGNSKNKRKVSVFTDIATPGTTRVKRAKTS